MGTILEHYRVLLVVHFFVDLCQNVVNTFVKTLANVLSTKVALFLIISYYSCWEYALDLSNFL